jgi:hypothetical protein
MAEIVDFRDKQRAAEGKAEAYSSHMDRLMLGVPLIAECPDKMRLAGLTDKEMARMLRHAAGQLD